MPENYQDSRNYGKVLFEWQVKEYHKFEKDWKWIVSSVIIGAILLYYSIVTGNFLFSLIIVLIGFIALLREIFEPQYLPFQITETGIRLGDKFYMFKEFNKFFIIYEPPEVKNLYFKTKSNFIPRLSIPLEKTNPLQVREILVKYLEEDLEEEDEPGSDAWTRQLKL